MAALKQRGRVPGADRSGKWGRRSSESRGGRGARRQRAFLCPQQLKRSPSVAEPCAGALRLSPLAVATCPDVGTTCPERLRLLDASPASSLPALGDAPEPRVTAEHTNNRIGESACSGLPGVIGFKRAVGRWVLGPGPPAGTRGFGSGRTSQEEVWILPRALASMRCFL